MTDKKYQATPGVLKACVIYHGSHLLGFYAGPNPIRDATIKSIVELQQPYYAVPSKFIYPTSFPMTPDGNIDKEALIASVTEVLKPTPVLFHLSPLRSLSMLLSSLFVQ